MPNGDYPEWFYYPSSTRPPAWVHGFIGVVAQAQSLIDSRNFDPAAAERLTSNRVLAHLRQGLEGLGFTVEAGGAASQRIRRPVLFGDQGRELVAYEVDGVHDEEGIVVEIEAGRGARGNAVYRDLIRSSLIVDVRFLVLGVASEYHHMSGGRPVVVRSYDEAKRILDAVFASGQLGLPFEGVLLFGY